jgi:hypothetical protein
MLSQLPLTKTFLGPFLDIKSWGVDVAAKLDEIRKKFKEKKDVYYSTINALCFFAANSKILNPDLPVEEKMIGQEILIALGFEAFLQKVDRKKYGPIFGLITSKLREIGLINEDVLMEKIGEILDWYDASWKIGYVYLPLILKQSLSEDEKTDQLSQDDKLSKEEDLGPFADFIKGLDL